MILTVKDSDVTLFYTYLTNIEKGWKMCLQSTDRCGILCLVKEMLKKEINLKKRVFLNMYFNLGIVLAVLISIILIVVSAVKNSAKGNA